MKKIRQVSLFFRMTFQMLLVAIPITLIVAWMINPESIVLLYGIIHMSFIPDAYLATSDHPTRILHLLSPNEKFLGFLVSAIPMSVVLYILYSLIQLFKRYENGEIFSMKNAQNIRHIGYGLLITQIISPIYQGLIGLVLTWNNPPKHGLIAITLDQTNVGIIFMALLVILISWIMTEGSKLREEQQLTI